MLSFLSQFFVWLIIDGNLGGLSALRGDEVD
jgi:hypothetical protein